jgi:hypothetical protein
MRRGGIGAGVVEDHIRSFAYMENRIAMRVLRGKPVDIAQII